MSVALASVFDLSVVSNILSYYSSRPDVEWEEVYGSCVIWRTKHFITYGGGPEGGYVYLFMEHAPGWYRWRRTWASRPSYEMVLDGQVAMRWHDHVEWLGVLPEDWEDHEWDDDEQEVLVLTHEQMQDET